MVDCYLNCLRQGRYREFFSFDLINSVQFFFYLRNTHHTIATVIVTVTAVAVIIIFIIIIVYPMVICYLNCLRVVIVVVCLNNCAFYNCNSTCCYQGDKIKDNACTICTRTILQFS